MGALVFALYITGGIAVYAVWEELTGRYYGVRK